MLSTEERLNVDETGHKENGRRLWTWCFRAYLYTVYKISPSRGSDVLVEVLGKEFDGVLGCDYFSAYRKYMHDFHPLLQFCLAHLIRDVKFLVEHPNKKNQTYGQLLLTDLRRLFGVIHRRDEYASAENFQRALEHARSQLVWDATRRSPLSREAFNLAQRFREHADSYFRFTTQPNVEPTNNLAEQAIRFVAIHRRITQGTRSEDGPLTSTGLAFDGYVVRVVGQPNGIPQTTWARQLDATGSVRHLSVALMPDQATIVVQGKFVGTIDVDPSTGVQARAAQGDNYDLFLVQLATADGSYVAAWQAGGEKADVTDYTPVTAPETFVYHVTASASGSVYQLFRSDGPLAQTPGGTIVTQDPASVLLIHVNPDAPQVAVTPGNSLVNASVIEQ